MVEYRNILFCTDFSEDANIAFLHALNLAKKYGAKLHVLHIPHSPFRYNRSIVDEHIPAGRSQNGQAFYDEEIEKQAQMDLREAYEKRMSDFGDYVFVVRNGAPDIEIVRYAKHNGIDLIVMGALGKSELERMVHGSTVAHVSRYAHCHVMAIKNPARQLSLPDK